jgi:glucose/arabinose dehydrogenase
MVHNYQLNPDERFEKANNISSAFPTALTHSYHYSCYWLGFIFLATFFALSEENIYGQEDDDESSPVINMPGYVAELVSDALQEPTGMAFIGPNEILVTEKTEGTVQKISNGQISEAPLLDVNVNARDERGLLGIAVAEDDGSTETPRYVFLYYTEAEEEDGGEPLGNRLYRYELVGDRLLNGTLLLDLPYLPGPAHNGGALSIGPDKNVYLAVGDMIPTSFVETQYRSKAQNYGEGLDPDGRGGILRVTQEGEVVDNSGLLGEGHPLDKYFAYGIRNSFGMDFDPITGNLWDTENGPSFGDEINLVFPGFNSGWAKILGGWYVNETINEESDDRAVNKGQETSFLSPDQSNEPKNLVAFDNHGYYSDPEFVWDRSIGPTSIIFMNSDKLGRQFENDIFVADVEGKIHNFNLVANRTQLDLSGTLSDKIANNPEELGDSIFASNFDIITDLEVGPDGYLYVLAGVRDVVGKIYKITYGSSAES